jgi:hypothetical protein
MGKLEVKLTKSEKRILRQIRRWLGPCITRYDFWFIEDENGEACGWEGGWRILSELHFRDQYSIECKGAHLVRNW